MHYVIYFIWDSRDNLGHMAVDNLADHMEAVLDTEQEGIQDSQAAEVHSQAVEDGQDSLGNHQLAEAAANSCKGCNLLATVEQ